MQSQNKKSATRSQLQQFGEVFALACIFVFFITGKSHLIWIYLSAAFLVITVFLPSIFRPFNYLWLGFGNFLGKIIGTILFAVIFYLLLTPLAFLRKLTGSKMLTVDFLDEPTFWRHRDKKNIEPADLEKQF